MRYSVLCDRFAVFFMVINRARSIEIKLWLRNVLHLEFDFVVDQYQGRHVLATVNFKIGANIVCTIMMKCFPLLANDLALQVVLVRVEIKFVLTQPQRSFSVIPSRNAVYLIIYFSCASNFIKRSFVWRDQSE